MTCGFNSMSLTDFSNAVCYLRRHDYWVDATQKQRDLLVEVIKMAQLRTCAHGGCKMSWVLQHTRNRECSDARDRIYAVLSLLPPEERLDIHPDYTASASSLYVRVVLQRLERQAHLQMLCYWSIKDRVVDVPSWVPDWSVDPKLAEFAVPAAGWCAKAHAYSISSGVLAVTGVCVTIVHEVKDDLLRKIPEERTESAEVLRQLLSKSSGQGRQ